MRSAFVGQFQALAGMDGAWGWMVRGPEGLEWAMVFLPELEQPGFRPRFLQRQSSPLHAAETLLLLS
jgi:hypothetical protein